MSFLLTSLITRPKDPFNWFCVTSLKRINLWGPDLLRYAVIKWKKQRHDANPSKDGPAKQVVQKGDRQDDLQGGWPNHVHIRRDVLELRGINRHQVYHVTWREFRLPFVAEEEHLEIRNRENCWEWNNPSRTWTHDLHIRTLERYHCATGVSRNPGHFIHTST